VARPAPSRHAGRVPTYDVNWNDERGNQKLEADDVILEDGIYEFWRGNEAFLRVPAADIGSIDPAASGS
jgi:hypothetical protein